MANQAGAFTSQGARAVSTISSQHHRTEPTMPATATIGRPGTVAGVYPSGTRGVSPRASPPGVRRPVREERPTSPESSLRDGAVATNPSRVGRLQPRGVGTNSHGGLPAASGQQRSSMDGGASASNLHPSPSASSGVGQAPPAASATDGAPAPNNAISAAAAIAAGVTNSTTTSLLAGSSLGHLIARVSTSVAEREQALRDQLKEQREMEELIGRSKDELQQLISVVSQLHELQLSASEVLPELVVPERPRHRRQPPFFWQPSPEYAEEFEVAGDSGEVVTKVRDFEDQGWVIPVGGALRMQRGGMYRWTLQIERKCPSRPQLQLGIHGVNHSQPWRLITTSRCSWSRDDEPWQDRPAGDRLIDEGDYVHMEVDLRGVHSKYGSLAIAINDEPFEQFFDDIPLGTPYPLMPVVSMGGDQSRVRLCASV
mmetsp:Transcript_43265/g.78750  ORF Transcript_43265/g.78750 Transcript_43265/m.78750 type:complete len:428 (+) Transcript_43265:102-1385(+)